ncbi:MAG: methyl-accepting chemotaxis protein [Cyanobacteria bacterium J06635_15]
MLANLFGGFQKLKIQHQIILLVLLSALIPAAVVGSLATISASSSLAKDSKATLQDEAKDEAKAIEAFLSGAGRDVLFFSSTPPVQGLLRAEANGGVDPQDQSSDDEWRERLEISFLNMLEAKSEYQKLRYIDETGQEIIRVERDNIERDQIRVVPNAELQDKADRPYYSETMKLAAGDIYVSPVALQREEGVVFEPYQPEIHYATPIEDAAGNQQGLVVASVFAGEFLNKLAGDEGEKFEDEERLVVNQDGYYLLHPNAEKAWGFDLGKEETLATDFTPAVAEQILSTDSGTIDTGDSILAYQKLLLSEAQSDAVIVIDQVPKSVVFASVNSFKLFASLAVLISLGLVVPLAILRGRQLVDLLARLAGNISTSTQEMATTIAEQERIASQQAASVNETTTTMDELEASSRHAAEQAAAAVVAAKQAAASSDKGSLAVGESLEGMFTLEQKVDSIADQIVTLSGQANQIGSISQLVIDFANQTNMLALNSSVEAVRAGEHGKGFAVVANEIRKLADQSQQSADKINTLVSEIQKSINETVMVTEEGTKTVKVGVQSAKRTEEAFGEVKEAVNQVVLNNQQVSLNLKQQVNAIEQVVGAMEVIDQGAKETASGLSETKQGTQQLNEAALGLQQMV